MGRSYSCQQRIPVFTSACASATARVRAAWRRPVGGRAVTLARLDHRGRRSLASATCSVCRLRRGRQCGWSRCAVTPSTTTGREAASPSRTGRRSAGAGAVAPSFALALSPPSGELPRREETLSFTSTGGILTRECRPMLAHQCRRSSRSVPCRGGRAEKLRSRGACAIFIAIRSRMSIGNLYLGNAASLHLWRFDGWL